MKTVLVSNREADILKSIKKLISEVAFDIQVYSFREEENVIEDMMCNHIDAIFIDLVGSGIYGILLGKKILARKTGINIIFVAASEAYATEAINMHASGYVCEPITKEKIQEEFDELRFKVADRNCCN